MLATLLVVQEVQCLTCVCALTHSRVVTSLNELKGRPVVCIPGLHVNLLSLQSFTKVGHGIGSRGNYASVSLVVVNGKLSPGSQNIRIVSQTTSNVAYLPDQD